MVKGNEDAMSRVYIAVPMRGFENLNRPLAEQIAEEVRALGHEPVIPHDIPVRDHDGECPGQGEYEGDGSHSGYCYLKSDMRELLLCDAVVLAPGWRDSKGAASEYALAGAVRIPTVEYGDLEAARRDGVL